MIYILMFLILCGTIINELYQKYSLTKITYKREVSKRLVEIGEDVEITSIIENNKILPVSFLRIIERLPVDFEYTYNANIFKNNNDTYHEFSISIMPYQRIKRIYKGRYNKRGRFILNDVTLTAGDILGLKEVSTQAYTNHQIVVLPSTYDIKNNLVNYGDFMGNISVVRWIISDPIINIGLREYTGFEPQNTIHWPSSLRMNKLMVKQFDYTTDSKIIIILNIECSKPFWTNIEGEKIEKCISIVRSIIQECEEKGIQYGMITNAQIGKGDKGVNNIFEGWGKAHFSRFLETLGCIDYGISATFEYIIQSFINSKDKNFTNIVITPNILNEYIKPINLLSKYSQKTVLISIDDNNIDKIDSKVNSFIEKRD